MLVRVSVVLALAATVAWCDDDATKNIGGLTWMTKNLNINTPDSWCYHDSASYCTKYGRLYTWEAAHNACKSKEDGKKWRLPNNDDWAKLVRFADSSVAGKKRKSKTGWNYKNQDRDVLNLAEGKNDAGKKREPESGNGTNDFGFSAMPGGYRYSDGRFYHVGYFGFWWSATEYGVDGDAYEQGMFYSKDIAPVDYHDKRYGFSVRCVKD
jgi:uncharacterized protein (TIGR02145 family)